MFDIQRGTLGVFGQRFRSGSNALKRKRLQGKAQIHGLNGIALGVSSAHILQQSNFFGCMLVRMAMWFSSSQHCVSSIKICY